MWSMGAGLISLSLGFVTAGQFSFRRRVFATERRCASGYAVIFSRLTWENLFSMRWCHDLFGAVLEHELAIPLFTSFEYAELKGKRPYLNLDSNPQHTEPSLLLIIRSSYVIYRRPEFPQ